jgi:hypothetical protein
MEKILHKLLAIAHTATNSDFTDTLMKSCSSVQRPIGNSLGKRWYIAKKKELKKWKIRFMAKTNQKPLTLANNNERMETNSYRLAETFTQMQTYGSHGKNGLVQKGR